MKLQRDGAGTANVDSVNWDRSALLDSSREAGLLEEAGFPEAAGGPEEAGLEVAEQDAVRSPARVLLVEDSEPDVFLVREALDQCDLRVDLQVLEDGELAVELIEAIDRDGATRPDLILLDLNLPKRSGTQVLERIRRSPACSQIPVVILTSSDSPKDRAQTARLGATDYFRKPSRLNEFMLLSAVVQKLLSE